VSPPTPTARSALYDHDAAPKSPAAFISAMALTFTLQDILIRYHRMIGRDESGSREPITPASRPRWSWSANSPSQGSSARKWAASLCRAGVELKEQSGGMITISCDGLGARPIGARAVHHGRGLVQKPW